MRTSRRSSSAIVSELLLVACAAWLAGSCSVEASTARRNVILVCWDTVRADHLGPYGYTARPTTPHLDELAAGATVFTDASATAGWTKPSVPSFLTGTLPAEHGVYEGSAHLELGKVTDVLPDRALTLAEVFQGRGYRTAAFVRNAQLRPGNGFEQGFEVYRDEVGDARDVRWAGLDWLDSLDDDEPFFLYLHCLDAHWPYDVPDEAAARFAPSERVEPFRSKDFEAVRDAVHDGLRTLTEEEQDDLLALYDGAIRYLDDQLGSLLDGLALRGLADDTVVCVIADHGEEFGEHGRIGHGHGLYENLLRVPFVLAVPGRPAQRVDHAVSLVDLFPTLLGTVGVPAPGHLLGVDRLAEPGAERPILAEHKAPDRYEQSLRDPGSGSKVVRWVRPPARPPADDFPARVGERWQAHMEPEDGGFHASELETDDDDPSDPLELKGMVEDLSPGRFRIAGIEVRAGHDTSLRLADGVTDDVLREGRGVKAEGRFEDGVLVAEKLKLYAPGDEVPLVLRGRVDALDLERGGGTLTLSGLDLGVDFRTQVEEAGRRSPRMSRGSVQRFLELGGAQAAAEGYALEARRYDLLADPAERSPSAADPLELPVLDGYGLELTGRRLYSRDDRIHLTREAVEALRDIGYAR